MDTPPPTPQITPPAKEHNSLRLRFLGIAFLLIVVLGTGVLGGWLAVRYGNDVIGVQQEQVVLQTRGELIRDIAERVGPSIVSINVRGVASTSLMGQRQQEGAGTGILLSEDGIIVTNRHVVPAGTTEVRVTLSDGTEYEGVQIIGRTGSNDSLDIAFLKIADTQGKKLTPAAIGDSAAMKVGDPVIAIGNALGQFQNTVTSGIISGYGREVVASSGNGSEVGNLENLFQTDAAINAGNSGGPLVNINGEVIGINTAVATGDAQGIGFAIPINDVAGLISSVKEKGVLERPFLGVRYVSLTNDAAEFYGLSVTRGAFIPPSSAGEPSSVISGGPADQAGVKERDIITKINSEAVDQTNSLAALVNKYRVGEQVELTVVRDGQEQTVAVTLGVAPTE
ncbi:MAG: S1C family serine protease [Candidatus Saccharimonadales bacterium]